MQTLKNFFSIATLILACVCTFQFNVLAQNAPNPTTEFPKIESPTLSEGITPNPTTEFPKIERPTSSEGKAMEGKDLVILSASMSPVETTKNGMVVCRVDFKVQNIGTEDVKTPATVLLHLTQSPVNSTSTQGQTTSELLLVNQSEKVNDYFETKAIGSGEIQTCSAFIPNFIEKGYSYQLKLKVDAHPKMTKTEFGGKVKEVNEYNNDWLLPETIM